MSIRLTDPSAIEARLLELAHTTDAKLTAPALAYFAPCSIDDAAAVLDSLAARDRVGMEIEDDGTIVYQLYGRQKLSPRPALEPPAIPPYRPMALAPYVPPARHASPLLAAVLTLVVPGAGHLYAGRAVAALLWFFVVSLGYVLILPGLILHLFSIASATNAARQLNEPRPRLQLYSGL
ncbi:MAG TPA: hypothetical protein VFQ53_24110 [Kofleriaceae bacterium]|nr:hypothetical protein [Kofleriaceae bacterium]